jgi:hypothetical protein
VKGAGLVVAALMLLAVGFVAGWEVRATVNPTVTVQMAPAERAYFMGSTPELPAGSPCRITGDLRRDGKPITAAQQKACDDDITADLAHVIRNQIEPRAHK